MYERSTDSEAVKARWKENGDEVFETEEDFRPIKLQPGWRSLAQSIMLDGRHLRYASPSVIRRAIRYIPSPLQLFIKRVSYPFVPQIIRTAYFNDPRPVNEIHLTSWMNGLRGLASFAVFNEHFVYFYTYTFVVGWGTRPTDKWIHQLPIIELFCDGVCGVVVFFTVAGYVCSYNPLQAITSGDYTALFRSLPASIFRRWFRLYLPVLCSTFCICFLAYVGAYEPTRSLFDLEEKASIFPGPGDEPQPPRYPTVALQLSYWWSCVSKMLNFWIEYPKDPTIDFHLWTIVYEYRASMHLYVVLVALAACKTQARIFILLLLGYVYVGRFSHWDLVCFFYGAVLAQLDILRLQTEDQRQSNHQRCKSRDSHGYDTFTPSTRNLDTEAAMHKSVSLPHRLNGFLHRSYRNLGSIHYGQLHTLRVVLYFMALYLMSFPIRGVKHPSLLYKDIVIPFIPAFYGKSVGPKFPKQVGTLLLMYLLTTVPRHQREKSLWHRFLTSGPCQYLGRIMFGLFLIHGMVLHCFGYAIPHWIWMRWNAENDGVPGIPNDMGMYLAGLFVGWVASLLVSLWVADVWTREVEGRCVRLTKWIEGRVFVKR